MGDRLAAGNPAIALLANSLATAAILVVLIICLAPLSGAHFNPAVTLSAYLQRIVTARIALAYCAVQVAGAIAGTLVAHLMFDLVPLEIGTRPRTGWSLWFSEFIATAGLIGTIIATMRHKPQAIAYTVALYIGAAYWFTASTSFANPAASIARGFTNSFAGIALAHVPMFAVVEFGAALLTTLLCAWLFGRARMDAPATSQTMKVRG